MTAHRALQPQNGHGSNPVHPFPGNARSGAGPVDLELTVLMPCLDEAETLERCIAKALGFMERAEVNGEVLIADNGSTDGSQDLAAAAGARVVHVPRKGYGAALIAGIKAARGQYVVMGDSDDSYDFSSLDNYLERLREGDELVMGNRFRGGVAKGAMPRLHRYFGNPFLTWAGRTLFGSPVGDFQCGLRGFSREVMLSVGLSAEGMEFASEMVMKSTLHGLQIGEVPTKLVPDGRSRPPHIRSWRDGWRNLRLLLMHSPRLVFTFPGALLAVIGLLLMSAVLIGPAYLAGLDLGTTAMVLGGGMVVLGAQVLSYGAIMRQYGQRSGHLPGGHSIAGQPRRLERALIFGLLLFATGFGGLLWMALGQAEGAPLSAVALVPAVTAMVVGLQTALFGFVSEFIALRREGDA